MAERPKPIGFEFGNMAVWIENRFKFVALFTGGGAEQDEDGTAAEPSERPSATRKGKDEAIKKELIKLSLFDIVSDAKEEYDLAAEQPERVQSMHAALEARRESCRQSLSGKDYQ